MRTSQLTPQTSPQHCRDLAAGGFTNRARRAGGIKAGLIAIALMVATVVPALARDCTIPIRGAFEAHRIASVENADGTSDQTFVGEGIATQLGRTKVVIQINAGIPFYDPVSDAFLVPLHGTFVYTAANGDTLKASIAGLEVIPVVFSLPLDFYGTQRVIGGTGRFAGARGSLEVSGLDHEPGVISFTVSGSIFTVGSRRR